jgi:imidazolonepropionase-like amidohydrolase
MAIFALLVLSASVAFAQSTAGIEPVYGMHENTPNVHAFINARIVTSPGHVIDKGTLVIRDGVIDAVGADVRPPADARVWDMAGMTIYPGLIESYSDYGMPKKPDPSAGGGAGGGRRGGAPQAEPSKTGPRHWNDMVLSATDAVRSFTSDNSTAEKLRGLGFTTVQSVPQMGVFRGSTAMFELSDEPAPKLVVKPSVAQYVTFETARGDGYPSSLIGTIALIRQTFYDVQWYKTAMAASLKYPTEPRPEVVEDLAALENAAAATQPVIMESTDEHSLLRAEKIAKEFKLNMMVRGTGYEYRRLDAVKATGMPVILPVNFPATPTVSTSEEALDQSLRDLRYWDEAPENPGRLQKAGVVFTLTTATLKDPTTFTANVHKAIDRGLPFDAALAALTTTPAKLFGIESKTGTLAAGKLANFIVTDGELFAEKTKLYETWVEGKRFEVKARPQFEARGTWEVKLNGVMADSVSLSIKGDPDKLTGSVKIKGKSADMATLTASDWRISFSFKGDSLPVNGAFKGVVRMTGDYSAGALAGQGELSNGSAFTWTASLKEAFKPEPDTSKPKPPVMATYPVNYPEGEFGRDHYPDQPADVFIKNATIWTSGPAGNIDGGDMIVHAGKIVQVGKGLSAPSGATVIDATGMQLTPGIIDCHSHTAVDGGVNEGTDAITAEVRIGDCLSPDDIAIYRELAGGTTCANVLHGSANPIGGQNQVIKLRWGGVAEDYKFEGAMPGIKFALGENVKQSNWGERYTTRYPQTREGVEQIYRDAFNAALDYEKAWKDYNDGVTHIPPRKNLRTDAIVEILQGKRLVHCHSYRQDEILMLMRVSDDFKFQLGTFQHGMECYKVADEIAKRGIGVSTFSDWWAYKMEVIDAMPYNGAILHDQDVLVSYNSDSDEQATRLNTEAAKGMKYGNVPPQDALKFVTINPAKQLRIDKRVGSLEAGKDADFVLWNGSPLSSMATAQQTWIDGRKFFDQAEDRKMFAESEQERNVLIQKVLDGKKETGAPTGGPRRRRGGDDDENFGGSDGTSGSGGN